MRYKLTESLQFPSVYLYTISTLNPVYMYEDYYNDDVINNFVGFRLVYIVLWIKVFVQLSNYIL